MNTDIDYTDPQVLANLMELAKRFYASGIYEDAQKIAVQLCRHDPLNVHVWKLSGAINYAMGRPDWAVGSYLRALMFAPLDWEAYWWLGRAYQHQGNTTRARECWVTAKKIAPYVERENIDSALKELTPEKH